MSRNIRHERTHGGHIGGLTARDEVEAFWAVRRTNARTRRDNRERHEAAAKKTITLPSMESLKKLLEDKK